MSNAAAPASNALWLCLRFSQLALEIFVERDTARPCAVIEQRLVHCSNRDDLGSGLGLATAVALYPNLLALERDAAREHEWLHSLAEWAYGFTPAVTMAADNCLLLEIGSCRKLYRGISNLLERLQRELQQRGHTADFGLAHTPKAAWLMAQSAFRCSGDQSALLPLHSYHLDQARVNQQLDAMPLTLLAVDAKIPLALQQAGIATLGALRHLPLSALGKRFGEPFIRYLQQIWGEAPDPSLFFTPAPRFQRGLSFIDGIAQRPMLLFPMKRLLQALDDYLRARQLHCHIFHWQLFDAHKLLAEFSVELSRTQSGWRNALELSRLKMERLPDIGEKNGDAVFSIALHSADFFAQAPHSDQLFSDARTLHAQGDALLDRLAARLGNTAVQQLDMCETHWPEQAYSLRRPLTASAADGALPPHGARPIWLLQQPQLLQQKHHSIYWRGPLTLLRGPERIGNHWWQQHGNERDYYIARNTGGSVCWIFCDRTTQQWFLHGLFA